VVGDARRLPNHDSAASRTCPKCGIFAPPPTPLRRFRETEQGRGILGVVDGERHKALSRGRRPRPRAVAAQDGTTNDDCANELQLEICMYEASHGRRAGIGGHGGRLTPARRRRKDGPQSWPAGTQSLRNGRREKASWEWPGFPIRYAEFLEARGVETIAEDRLDPERWRAAGPGESDL